MYGLLYQAQDIVGVAHMGRTIPAHLRPALVERDQVCVVSGCDKMCCLEFDHVTEFTEGGPASMANLVRMCSYHHALKTYHGYKLQRVGGRWILVPPEQPGAAPLQPELASKVSRDVVVVRKNRIRELPGTAPPNKKNKRRSGRPAPWDRVQFGALLGEAR